eukprot:TRINITY_DN5954_c0_g3_i1.p1 TRINITY_DN5954_c0_g3~~TRINITY_DN5954_c0_g3_i1.p1  ORF type:complete len:928 (-),score=126.52 TRINITY_DN5954_c0_g3_i1:403-3186(-)
MVRQDTQEYTYDLPWEVILEAYKRRFPTNPKMPFLLETKIVEYKFDLETLVEMEDRECRVDLECPGWVKRMANCYELQFSQKMTVDYKNKVMKLTTDNLSFSGTLNMHEECTYRQHPTNPEWTYFTQTASLSLPSYANFAEPFCIKTYSKNTGKGRLIDREFSKEVLLDKKFRRPKGLPFAVYPGLDLAKSMGIPVEIDATPLQESDKSTSLQTIGAQPGHTPSSQSQQPLENAEGSSRHVSFHQGEGSRRRRSSINLDGLQPKVDAHSGRRRSSSKQSPLVASSAIENFQTPSTESQDLPFSQDVLFNMAIVMPMSCIMPLILSWNLFYESGSVLLFFWLCGSVLVFCYAFWRLVKFVTFQAIKVSVLRESQSKSPLVSHATLHERDEEMVGGKPSVPSHPTTSYEGDSIRQVRTSFKTPELVQNPAVQVIDSEDEAKVQMDSDLALGSEPTSVNLQAFSDTVTVQHKQSSLVDHQYNPEASMIELTQNATEQLTSDDEFESLEDEAQVDDDIPDNIDLEDLKIKIKDAKTGIQLKNHWSTLRKVGMSFTGADGATWICNTYQRELRSRKDAVMILQRLLTDGFLRSVKKDPIYRDGPALYAFSEEDSMRELNPVNYTGPVDPIDPEKLAIALLKQISHIYVHYLKSTSLADLKLLLEYEEFRAYTHLASRLHYVDISALSAEQKIAFFLNIYSALSLHGYCVRGSPNSQLQRSTFHSRVTYKIGQHTYNLNDIFNGILRGNRNPSGRKTYFAARDPRAQYALMKLDPRIHFAVSRAIHSGPNLYLYDSEFLDQELIAASEEYCATNVIIDTSKKLIVLPYTFYWYEADFGRSRPALLQGITSYLPRNVQPHYRRLLESADYAVKYAPYYWSLDPTKLSVFQNRTHIDPMRYGVAEFDSTSVPNHNLHGRNCIPLQEFKKESPDDA